MTRKQLTEILLDERKRRKLKEFSFPDFCNAAIDALDEKDRLIEWQGKALENYASKEGK